MASMPSLRVVKRFHYRGQERHFSNRYHFYGGTPADVAHWNTFGNAVVAAEKLIYTPFASVGAEIIQLVGYEAGSEIPVWTGNYSDTGTAANDATAPPGDVAGLVRISTADRSSKNHPIYMFSYYHTMQLTTTGGSSDTLSATCAAALGVYANKWVSVGFSDGANTYKRASPAGHHATGYTVNPLVTHRDLPR